MFRNVIGQTVKYLIEINRVKNIFLVLFIYSPFKPFEVLFGNAFFDI